MNQGMVIMHASGGNLGKKQQYIVNPSQQAQGSQKQMLANQRSSGSYSKNQGTNIAATQELIKKVQKNSHMISQVKHSEN